MRVSVSKYNRDGVCYVWSVCIGLPILSVPQTTNPLGFCLRVRSQKDDIEVSSGGIAVDREDDYGPQGSIANRIRCGV